MSAETKASNLHRALTDLLGTYKGLVKDTNSEPTFGAAPGVEEAERALFDNRPLADWEPARFPKTFCSQCGGTFGPGNSGYSHCDQHTLAPDKRTVLETIADIAEGSRTANSLPHIAKIARLALSTTDRDRESA